MRIHPPMTATLIAVLILPLLAACAPDYDWREIRSSEHGYAVLLPGKPATMTRTVNLDGVQVPMTMQGAKVDDAAFTVAVAELPDDRPETRERALAAMRAGMLRNIGAADAGTLGTMDVPFSDPQGRPLGQLQALTVRAQGAGTGRPLSIAAGFLAEGPRAWQWVALGPALPPEQAQVFLSSFKRLQVTR